MTRITEDTQEMACPFCGNAPFRTVGGLIRCDGTIHWPHRAILLDDEAWNTRASVVGERDALRAAAMGMRQVLVRYRNETPLGHQPHMIAHVADLAIAEFDAALSPNQGERS